MREHGTRACYVFGPEPGAGDGCRCVDCSIAAGDYEKNRQRLREAGIPAYVDATEAREHLEWLQAQGVGLRTIAARTGLGRSTLTKIRSGEVSRCRPDTADRILGVPKSIAADGAYIDGTDTLRRIEEILEQGWTRVAIARRVVSPDARSLQIGGNGRVTAATAAAVKALHQEVMAPVEARREWQRHRQRDYRARRRAS